MDQVSKKVNRHVIKAIDYLQTSRTDFVHIEAIQERVRRSLRYTKPVSNLEDMIQDSLRKQTELGIVTRSGSSMYAMTIAFQGLRCDRSAQQIKKRRARCDYLTTDEIAGVRKMLRSVQKPWAKVKPSTTKALYKTNSVRNFSVRSKKPSENSTPIICDESGMGIWSFNIPKKVNRHVFKAVKHYTEHENHKFVPLDKIKMEVKWSMRNLNPVKDVETVIERSLTNLKNIGVLSERLGSYRLNCVTSLHSVDSYSIFGKVSKSFFPVEGDSGRAPSVEHASSIELGCSFDAPLVTAESISRDRDESQSTSYIKECEMSLDDPSSESIYLKRESYIEPEQTSSLVPIMFNFRAPEGVFGVDPTSENASSIELSGGQMPLDEPISESIYLDGQSYIEPEQTFRAPEVIPPFENPSCVELPLITLANPSSWEAHNAHTEGEIGLSSPDSNISFLRAAQSFHESWLQSKSNEQPLFLGEANYEVEQSSNEAQNAVLKQREEPEEQ